MSRGHLPSISDAIVADILQDLYAGTLEEEAWNRALVRITDVVGGAGVVFVAMNPSTGTFLRAEAHRFDPQTVRDMTEHWATKDIRVPRGVSIPLGVVHYDTMNMSLREWRNSEIYNDFLIPNDSPYRLATWVHKSPTKVAAMTFQATAEQGPYDESDAARLRPFVPHLQRAIAIRDRLQATDTCASTLAPSMERLTFGLIALDEVGGIIETNSVAEELLRSETVISAGSDRTLRLNGAADAELRRWILKGITADSRPDHLVQVERRDGRRPLSLMITPMPRTPVRWTSMDPRWIVFLFDPERQVMPVATVLARELGISAREAEVAAHLSSGKSLKQISRSLGVSDHTVRTHLKAIYAKTGLGSQAELVRRVVTGPSIHAKYHGR